VAKAISICERERFLKIQIKKKTKDQVLDREDPHENINKHEF
jgi:hypothetical protein